MLLNPLLFILHEVCLIWRHKTLYWLHLYLLSEMFIVFISYCPPVWGCLCCLAGCFLYWKWMSIIFLSLPPHQPDRVLGHGSAHCVLSVLLGLLRVFGLRSQGAGRARPHVIFHLSGNIKVWTAGLGVTTDSSAFASLAATNSVKLQVSFFPFLPLSFEFSALEEKCSSSKSASRLTLCAQLLALAPMLLKLSLVWFLYIFKTNHPPPRADARCSLGRKPAVFVGSAVSTSTLADVCSGCVTLLARRCLACIEYKRGQLLHILLMLMVGCSLSNWTYYY